MQYVPRNGDIAWLHTCRYKKYMTTKKPNHIMLKSQWKDVFFFFSFKNLYTGEGIYIEHMEVLVLLLALFRTTSMFFVFILAGLWFWKTFQRCPKAFQTLYSPPVVEHNLKKTKCSGNQTFLFKTGEFGEVYSEKTRHFSLVQFMK